MDTKITKKRLNDFLSYEWIKIIALAAAGILLWSFVFTVSAVRLSVGQQFKIFLYHDVTYGDGFASFSTGLKDKGALSFDVLEYSYESLLQGSTSTVLQARFAVHEGDLMVISSTDEEGEINNLKNFVDMYRDAYAIDSLMSDAKAYYERYYNGESLNYVYLKESFKQRMKKDKRFKTAEDYDKGAILEAQRIDVLKRAWGALDTYFKGENTLIEYARYTQYLELNPDAKDIEVDAVSKPYAITIENIPEITNLFKKHDGTPKDLALVVLDRKVKQPHLQYEVLPVICEILNLEY